MARPNLSSDVDMSLVEAFEAARGESLPDYAAQIPGLVLNSLLAYVVRGQEPGHFVTAFLCNDLGESINRADKESIKAFQEIRWLVYWFFPGDSWGSREQMKAWMEKRQVERTATVTS